MIDTHCHLDDLLARCPEAPARWRKAGVTALITMGTHPAQWPDALAAAQRVQTDGSTVGVALGIHPWWVDAVATLPVSATLTEALDQSPLPVVAVGEIGLDFFVPGLDTPAMREKQEFFLREQLKLARRFDLPVLLHSRRSVDAVLKLLRQVTPPGGIAHAFVGSRQQADAFIGLGCKLGFGGAMTFERATRLRALATELPLDSIVLETDSPDIAPHWLYVTAEERAAGRPQARNTPAEIPRIGQVLADLRAEAVDLVREQTSRNALQVLPRLQALLAPALGGA